MRVERLPHNPNTFRQVQAMADTEEGEISEAHPMVMQAQAIPITSPPRDRYGNTSQNNAHSINASPGPGNNNSGTSGGYSRL
jgi:hypothetical protein